MRFIRDLRYTLGALSAAKSRTFLTMLGVIIGVASVLAVSSIGESAQELVVGQVTSLGGNVIGVLPGASQENGPPPIAFGIVTATLTVDDAHAIAAIPGVVAVTPYVRSAQPMSWRGESVTTIITGVEEDAPMVENFEVGEGRFISSQDVSGFGRVIVLGHSVAQELFPFESPIDQRVRVKGTEFQVIGVVEERGQVAFQDQDDLAFIPATTAQKLIAGVKYVDYVRLRVEPPEAVGRVKDELKRLLRRRHNIQDPSKDDFTVRSTDQALNILGNVTGAMKSFLLVVTAISLLVGGINIMNVMYVSVRERTREIGLRKAVGARPARILAQFLMESAAISLLGGFVGMALGVAMTYAVSFAVSSLGYAWTFILPLSAVAWSVVTSLAVGMLFGIAPAVAAASLDPIVALRYE